MGEHSHASPDQADQHSQYPHESGFQIFGRVYRVGAPKIGEFPDQNLLTRFSLFSFFLSVVVCDVFPNNNKSVDRTHGHWVDVRVLLQHNLMRPLASRITNFPTTETNVTKSTKTVIEMRSVETNEYFRFLEECVAWVDVRLVRHNTRELASVAHMQIRLEDWISHTWPFRSHYFFTNLAFPVRLDVVLDSFRIVLQLTPLIIFTDIRASRLYYWPLESCPKIRIETKKAPGIRAISYRGQYKRSNGFSFLACFKRLSCNCTRRGKK